MKSYITLSILLILNIHISLTLVTCLMSQFKHSLGHALSWTNYLELDQKLRMLYNYNNHLLLCSLYLQPSGAFTKTILMDEQKPLSTL